MAAPREASSMELSYAHVCSILRERMNHLFDAGIQSVLASHPSSVLDCVRSCMGILLPSSQAAILAPLPLPQLGAACFRAPRPICLPVAPHLHSCTGYRAQSWPPLAQESSLPHAGVVWHVASDAGRERGGVTASDAAASDCVRWMDCIPVLLTQLAAVVEVVTSTGVDMAGVVLDMGEESEPRLPPLEPRLSLLLLAASHDVYAPWCSSSGRGAAKRVMGSVDAAGVMTSQRHVQPLLTWCRAAMHGERWKRDNFICVRYVAVWVITHMHPDVFAPALLADALPMALKLCDDWESTSAWLGASGLGYILSVVPTTLLRMHVDVIVAAVERLHASRDACVLHCAAFVSGLALFKLYGPAPAFPASLALDACLDDVYDRHVQSVCSSIMITSDADVMCARLTDASVVASVMQRRVGAHLTQLQDAVFHVVGNTGDARVLACCLQLLMVLMHVCPARYTVTGDEACALTAAAGGAAPARPQGEALTSHAATMSNEDALVMDPTTKGILASALPRVDDRDPLADANARADNIDCVLACCSMASAHVYAGLYILPGLERGVDDDDDAALAAVREFVSSRVHHTAARVAQLSAAYAADHVRRFAGAVQSALRIVGEPLPDQHTLAATSS